MRLNTWRACALSLHSWVSLVACYHWPSPQYDALEALLYEGRRVDGSNMASLQHPCKLRSGTQASVGAEWLRLAYHDTATHNALEGTGGLDASIAFELDREENFGAGMHQSLADFESFSNKYISRSDVIALGTVFAIASCGGPIIPFRGGRVDAYSSGPPGVPEVHQDIATHTRLFSQQGFNTKEMITLVACGHTLGGVRSTDFPTVVPPNSDSALLHIESFDSTRQFDNQIVKEYLDGTTGNPLVVVGNSTLRSDFRIFSSDNNETMQSLASTETFIGSCSSIIERMLNMVPSGVTLTEPIDLLHVKVSDAQLTFERGELVFKASFRLTQPIGTSPSKARTVKLLWCNRYGLAKDCQDHANVAMAAAQSRDDPEISPITSRLGYFFIRYEFVVLVDPSLSVSLFWFEVDEHDGTPIKQYDNDSTGYAVSQDGLFYIPELSSVNFHGVNDTIKTYDLVAAVRNDIRPTRVYLHAFDNAMANHSTPLNTTFDLKLNQSLLSPEGYALYSTVVVDVGSQLTVDIYAISDQGTLSKDFLQTYFLDKNIPYTPPTPVETTIAYVPQPSPTHSSSFTLSDWTNFTYLHFFIFALVVMLH